MNTLPPLTRFALFEEEQPLHRLERRMLAVGGDTYQLFLAVPKAAPPPEGFPILYLLDGNAAFDLMTPQLLAQADGMVLAGIGYDTDRRFDPPSRLRDYAPVVDLATGRGGHAEQFFRRLSGPIQEEAERDLPIDTQARALFGHSIAGLFCLHTLLTHPGAFQAVIAASPAVWWADEFILALEAKTPTDDTAAEVLVLLGDTEQRSNGAGPYWSGPAPHTLEMIERLRRRSALQVTAHLHEGLGHGATLLASLPPAFAFLRDRFAARR